MTKKIAVYTALMGRYESFLDDAVPEVEDVDLIVFTDDPNLRSLRWKVVLVDPVFPGDSVRSARFLKTTGHPVLEQYEFTIWKDNRIRLLVEPAVLVADHLGSSDIAMPLHSYRDTVAAEFDAVLKSGFDDPARIREQRRVLESSAKEVLHQRPYWTAIIVRRSSRRMDAAMALWFHQITRYSRRDQLSINAVLSWTDLQESPIDIDNWKSPLHEWMTNDALPKNSDILFNRSWRYTVRMHVWDSLSTSRVAVQMRHRVGTVINSALGRGRGGARISPAGGTKILTGFFSIEERPSRYATLWQDDKTPNRTPYGLEHLPSDWTYELAAPRRCGASVQKAAKAVRRGTGLDLLSAALSARALLGASVIYAHTEREFLAVGVILRALRAKRQILVGQPVWLAEDWPKLGRLRRLLWSFGMARVDFMPCNSPGNLRWTQGAFPRLPSAFVPFGVAPSFMNVPDSRTTDKAPTILTVGNDRARDWPTLARALPSDAAGPVVRVASSANLPEAPPSWVIQPTATVSELKSLYADAGVVVVAVRENHHCSGITTMLEAAAAAAPMVATRDSGLLSYFSEDEVLWVEQGDDLALREAVGVLLADRSLAVNLGVAARDRFVAEDYSLSGYWVRVCAHVDAILTNRSTT